jgi:DNA-binding transcriptional LysR family regulator
MNELETRQLRYFVAVADELHFGRAAERLGIAQPPLSKAIRDLERQLGVQLLTRTTRQVGITEAGKVFLRDARGVLDAIASAVRRARQAGQPQPVLRVALKADFDGGLLAPTLDAYAGLSGRSASEVLPVELVLLGPGEQVPALRDGRADVAIVVTPYDERGVESEPLLTEPRMVALPAADPLAARTDLRLADLVGRRLPNGSAADSGNISPPPPGSAEVLDLAQLFNLVEVGRLVWFVPAWIARQFPRPNIAYRPMPELPPATLAITWLSEQRSRAVAAFVRTAQEVATAATASKPGLVALPSRFG